MPTGHFPNARPPVEATFERLPAAFFIGKESKAGAAGWLLTKNAHRAFS
jgi:hypothetical protein